ncbi:DUF2125 domain-containing protein [Pseudorhodobacter aquimaris]|uniref:DUF2125 domain-containing protein n=1 Tax=Pseudorhodobacter aquimaris TaxID=687412 RepID=UPI00067C0693|nr:DUF2125 domain-containing protein [Pseudorhodobacter aquimaris]
MRWLTGLVLVLVALWSGYWFIGARGFEGAANSWITSLQDNGKTADHDGLAVRGFPNRFDLTVTRPQFADPATGIGWQSAFVQLFSLSYKPWHLIAAFAPEQRLTLPYEGITLRTEKMQASLVASPLPTLPLDRITLIGDMLTAEGDSGWSLRADALRFASRKLKGDAHEVALTLTEFAPDPQLMTHFGGILPDRIGLIRLDTTLGFTAPIDRLILETRPRLATLDLAEARVDWGNMHVSAKGRLIADSAGFAEGDIMLKLTNWPLALDVAQQMGLIAPDARQLWEQAAGFLAQENGDTLEIPVSLRNGRAMVGAIPVGPAPRLR